MKKPQQPQAPSIDDRLAAHRADFGLKLVEIEDKVEVVREGFEAGSISTIEERVEELGRFGLELVVLAARVVEVEKLKGN